MMLKRFFFILIMMTCVLHVGAQEKFNPVQFRADLHKRLIADARLTQEEADKFFPVFDEMKDKQRELHKQMKSLGKQKPGSDAACKSVVFKKDKLEMQMKQLEASYHERFMKILSPSKVYDLLKSESRFQRETFRKMARNCNK